MYAKLSKIERKLSTLDLEDLSLLEVSHRQSRKHVSHSVLTKDYVVM